MESAGATEPTSGPPHSAHGGELVDLFAAPAESERLRRESATWPSIDLGERELCDLELLVDGGFSPLRGFLGRRDFESVVASMRLADGTLWPIPVTLPLSPARAEALGPGAWVALRDEEGTLLAGLEISDVWRPDLEAEARGVYGTLDRTHPGVARLLARPDVAYAGGRVVAFARPVHHDFRELRPTPAALRAEFARLGWRRIVGFQTRNPLHRAHVELTLRAARAADANLLLHPVVGATREGDVDRFTRVRTYRAVLPHYPPGTAKLALLPLAMRMAGPREALWHALVRRNHGCTHFVVGRDHAGPGVDASGRPFYAPYAAQELALAHEAELGIGILPFRNMVFVAGSERWVPENELAPGEVAREISGTELRRLLSTGLAIPEWFTYPEVAAELRRTHPPRARQGFTVFFTGLSGAGKSTLANALRMMLLEQGDRPVTLLDGDVVRKHLSSELGFSREHRDLNIRRIGFVASEITKNGGAAICAPIAPYDAVRREVRELVAPLGGFFLVHVSTPIEVCERRDRKGLYAKARVGLLGQFTGVSDPYEEPRDADLVVDTTDRTPEEAARTIFARLVADGYLAPR